ncbi:MAG TPA: lipopolysaccharide assembly protein LapA domain-containing protein [Kineobactrum sp.]
MKLLRKILYVLVGLAMLLAGVLFSLQNRDPIALDLLIYRFSPHSLALWLLSALGIGSLLGLLASGFIILRLRASLAATRRKLDKCHQELDASRIGGTRERE